MAMEKIHPTSFRFQSPGAESVRPMSRVKRQVEGGKCINLADAKMHCEGGRRYQKAVESRTGNGVIAIKK